jgi:hypothetical protein
VDYRKKILKLRTITTARGVYAFTGRLRFGKDWKYLRDLVVRERDYLLDHANEALGLLRIVTKHIDAEFRDPRQRRNYTHIFESFAYRSAVESDSTVDMAYQSIQRFCDEAYSHSPSERTIKGALGWYTTRGFTIVHLGTRWDMESCTRIRLVVMPDDDKATDADTDAWLARHADTWQAVLWREQSARDERLGTTMGKPAELHTYIDDNGQRRMRFE